MVIDTGVRDIAELTAMNFPVWSRTLSAQGIVKETPGNVPTPIVCAGVYVRPGGVEVGDHGVVVVRREDAVAVVDASRERDAKEQDMRQRFASGELVLDLYALREKPTQRGLVYREGDPS